MSTYDIPNLSSDQAGSLAGSMNSSGYPFTMTQSGSGYSVDTNSEGAAYLGSAFGSSSSATSMPDSQIVDDQGNVHSSAASTNSTPQEKALSNSVSDFFGKFGPDAIAIVVGLIVTLAAVWKIV